MTKRKELDFKRKNLTSRNPYGINDAEGHRHVADRTPERMEREHAQQEIAYSLSRELAEHFNSKGHGAKAIDKLYRENPRAYLELCAKLVPKTNPLQNAKSGFLELLAKAHASLPPGPVHPEKEINRDYIEGQYAEETGHITSAGGGATQDQGTQTQGEGAHAGDTGIEANESGQDARVSQGEHKKGTCKADGKAAPGHPNRRRDTDAETKAKRQANAAKARAAKAAKRAAKESA